jgi:hypothetical protein
MWRIVLSERRLTKKKGTWHTFPDGKLEQFTPAGRNENGHAVFAYNPLHALSVVTEIRETPMYPHKGWILERWLPPLSWGTKADWNEDAGPYPSQGDYFIILGPWPEIPDLWFLEQEISKWNREWDEKPKDFAAAYKQFLYEEQEEERRANEQMEADLQAFFRGEIQPIFKSTSLAAQRLRNECAEAAGNKSHVGVQ